MNPRDRICTDLKVTFLPPLSGVSCCQTPARRRSSTLSVCPQAWGLPASSKPPSTAPWTSLPRPSTPAPTTLRLWLPATLTPCVWTPSPRGSPSPTLYPHLLHQHLQMTQILASRTDCGISPLLLQPQFMVSFDIDITLTCCGNVSVSCINKLLKTSLPTLSFTMSTFLKSFKKGLVICRLKYYKACFSVESSSNANAFNKESI